MSERETHLEADCLADLERLLPNGFHDAELRSLRLDLLERRLSMELDLWVDEDVIRERYRRGLLELGVAGQLVVEGQDPRYPFGEVGPVRIDLSIERAASEAAPERARFFVQEWNSFIVVEDRGAVLRWLEPAESR